MAKEKLFRTGVAAGQPKASYFNLKNAVAFGLGSESVESLVSLGYSERQANEIITNGYWQMVISSVQERHSEGIHILNSLADSYTAFATGAQPIEIGIQGHLYLTKDEDHRADFLHMYHERARGTAAYKQKLVLLFFLKDTVMRIRLKEVNFNYSSTLQEWVGVTLAGTAFDYRVYGVDTSAYQPPDVEGTLMSQLDSGITLEVFV